MSEMPKSADQVYEEKREDRGWNQDDEKIKSYPNIEPLPYSQEEYYKKAQEIASKAIKSQDVSLCEMYFELQRRAVYGNGYAPITGLEYEEEEMWNIGLQEDKETLTPKR